MCEEQGRSQTRRVYGLDDEASGDAAAEEVVNEAASADALRGREGGQREKRESEKSGTYLRLSGGEGDESVGEGASGASNAGLLAGDHGLGRTSEGKGRRESEGKGSARWTRKCAGGAHRVVAAIALTSALSITGTDGGGMVGAGVADFLRLGGLRAIRRGQLGSRGKRKHKITHVDSLDASTDLEDDDEESAGAERAAAKGESSR